MKKIIAAAVASAFIAPAFAAEVTVGGDVEFKFQKLKSEGVSSTVGDSDFFISGTEEVDGLTITATIVSEEASNVSDSSDPNTSSISVAGSFGKIAVGNDVDHAINQQDEVAVVAESGLGDATPAVADSDTVKVAYTFPTIVDGLAVIASYGAGSGTLTDDLSSTEAQNSSFSAKYSMNGVGIVYARASGDDYAETMTYTSVSFATGPFFVAYDSVSNSGGVDGTDDSAIGITYNYGPGKLYYEDQKEETTSTSVSNSAYGVSYKIGGMNTYIEMQSGDTDAEDGMTVGVEYAF